MSQQNKDLVRRMMDESMNKKRLEVLDEIIAPDYVWHGPGGQELKGVQGLKELSSTYLKAFPDVRMYPDDQVAEGDKVVTRWTARGTHRGDLMGIKPTGRQVTITGIQLSRIAGGKIIEEWEIFDQMGIMQQLGVMLARGEAKR